MPLPTPRAPRDGWVLGCAVKKGNTDLAKEIQQRLVELSAGPALREMFARHGVNWKA